MSSSRGSEILAALLAAGGPEHDLPARLVEACGAALPGNGVGLVLRTASGPAATLAATTPWVTSLEELQFTLGEGPGVDAVRSGRPVLEPDLARTGPARWPAFVSGALAVHVGAVFALPLRIGDICLGTLALYRAEAGPLSDDDLAEVLSFCDVATAVLLHQQADGADGPMTLVEDRAEVHQATGMISVQAGVPLGQALVLLRAHAYATDRQVSAVARDVLAGSVDFSEDDRQGPGH